MYVRTLVLPGIRALEMPASSSRMEEILYWRDKTHASRTRVWFLLFILCSCTFPDLPRHRQLVPWIPGRK